MYKIMKIQSNLSKITVITVALAAGLASTWSLAAADLSASTNLIASNLLVGCLTNLYSRGGAGVSILQNMTGHNGNGVIQFDVGPKYEQSLGYNIMDNVAVELQTGFAYNGMSKVNGQPASNGDLWTVPVMVNGIYKYGFNGHWQVYGGVGAGPLISIMDTSGSLSQSYTDCEFGYQAMLGVNYRFNDAWECGLGYGFLGSLDHHFNTTTSPTYMHSVELSLTRFW